MSSTFSSCRPPELGRPSGREPEADWVGRWAAEDTIVQPAEPAQVHSSASQATACCVPPPDMLATSAQLPHSAAAALPC